MDHYNNHLIMAELKVTGRNDVLNRYKWIERAAFVRDNCVGDIWNVFSCIGLN